MVCLELVDPALLKALRRGAGVIRAIVLDDSPYVLHERSLAEERGQRHRQLAAAGGEGTAATLRRAPSPCSLRPSDRWGCTAAAGPWLCVCV